ncbi:MAG: hypothetical protein JNM50_11995 [Chromatiales bacterium]|jgi:hypothetical protein|nr:hypothetical protein [Chromatiales bacterium]
MATNQDTRSRPVRRQGAITVRGVRLTAKQSAEFAAHLLRRTQTNHRDGLARQEELALLDTLHPYRASTRAAKELLAISKDVMNSGLATGGLNDWPFWQPESGKLQLDVLRGLARQLTEQAGRLRALEAALRNQYREGGA